jgi:phosphate starvation-inducible protein PhoH and related proteins
MLKKTSDEEKFRQKRIVKNPIKFKISLNEEQKKAKDIVLSNTITLIAGKAGSGKTLLACQIALDGLFTKQFEKIVITRPTVSKEDIGFLPGDLHQKMDPWVQPIYQNMYLLYNKDKIDSLIQSGQIELVPVSFMRGRTFLDACIICDEAQNVTNEQMEMITTRIGLRSKMIICGDDGQVDLKNRKDSGFRFLYSCADFVKGLGAVTLLQNNRHPIVDELLQIYEKK